MKKNLITVLIVLFFAAFFSANVLAQPEPPYAEWSRIAIYQAQQKYGASSVTDYLHIGRRAIHARLSEELFKLQITQPGKQFSVYAAVGFDPLTNTLQYVHWHETNRAPSRELRPTKKTDAL